MLGLNSNHLTANTSRDVSMKSRPTCETTHVKGVSLQGVEPLKVSFAEPRRGENSVGVFFVVFEMDCLVQIHGIKILPARDEMPD